MLLKDLVPFMDRTLYAFRVCEVGGYNIEEELAQFRARWAI
jgi:hypothetical protein